MKSIGFVATAVTAVAVTASGCASIPFTSERDPAIDTARIAQVERVTAGRGIGVYWVNLPTRKVTPVATVAPAAPAAPASSGT